MEPVPMEKEEEKKGFNKVMIAVVAIMILAISGFGVYILTKPPEVKVNEFGNEPVIVDAYSCKVAPGSDMCDTSLKMVALCKYYNKTCSDDMAFDVRNESGHLVIKGCVFINNGTFVYPNECVIKDLSKVVPEDSEATIEVK